MKNILKALTWIKNQWVYWAIISTVGAAAWGGVEWLAHRKIKKMEEEVWKGEVIMRLEDTQESQIVLNKTMDSFLDSLGILRESVEQNNQNINMTQRIIRYEREHRGEVPQEQLNEFLLEMEKLLKKNGLTIQSPSSGSNEWTAYESITETEKAR